MNRTKVEKGYRIRIPEPLQPSLKIGDELLIGIDQNGRFVMIPESRLDEILEATFGLWRDRKDIHVDGADYVDQVRQGRRIRRLTDDRVRHYPMEDIIVKVPYTRVKKV